MDNQTRAHAAYAQRPTVFQHSSLRSGVRRVTGWFSKKPHPQAIIVLYHRVAEAVSDPQALCVTPQHFAEHLDVLQRGGVPLRLREMVSALRADRLLPRSVIVTFDDGYADTLQQGKPLLERAGVPATIFVTSGAVDRAQELWWDELERLVLHEGRLPETLRLRISGHEQEWRVGAAAQQSHELQRWTVLERHDPTPRHALYRSLCERLRPLPTAERERLFEVLRRWGGPPPSRPFAHRVLSPDEVVQVAQSGLVDVGAHTVTHPVLARLSLLAQQQEIEESKRRLESILGRAIDGFAYPYGTRHDYTRATVALVQRAGFAYACANRAGAVGQGSDLFQLPRLLVRNWDGDEFARRLRAWWDD